MPAKPDVVVIQNEPGEGLGLLEPALREAGFAPTVRLREVKPEDLQASLVVVLGGPMGVYEARQHPFLEAEQGLLRDRLSRGKPSLGICLGAQLLASAAGARVYPGNSGFEIGPDPVELTPEALADPLFQGFPPALPAAHWHGDTHEPVPNAVLLARTSRYEQQAFRVGGSFGFQFHPEVGARHLADWLAREPKDVARGGRSLQTLLAQLAPLEAAERHWRTLLSRLALRFAKAA